MIAALVLGSILLDEQPATVALLPLGKVDAAVVKLVRERLESKLPVRVTVLKASPLPRSAYYEPRGRYRADKLLPWLAGQRRAGYVMGLTGVDVSTTLGDRKDWGVFGLGQMPGRAAVVSYFRLRKSKGVNWRERTARVAVHELGHNLGLPHCPRPCIMADARGSIKSVDAFTDFCLPCNDRVN